MSVLAVCMPVCHVCVVPPEARRGPQVRLELEAWTVVSSHMGAKDQAQVIWKSIQCFLTAEPSLQHLFFETVSHIPHSVIGNGRHQLAGLGESIEGEATDPEKVLLTDTLEPSADV